MWNFLDGVEDYEENDEEEEGKKEVEGFSQRDTCSSHQVNDDGAKTR